MKNNLLKALKVFIYIIVIGAAIGFILHFICGIRDSLFADDEITNQDRILSAYQFIYMAASGVIMVAALYSTKLIKIHLFSEEVENKLKSIPCKIKQKFSKKENK